MLVMVDLIRQLVRGRRTSRRQPRAWGVVRMPSRPVRRTSKLALSDSLPKTTTLLPVALRSVGIDLLLAYLF